MLVIRKQELEQINKLFTFFIKQINAKYLMPDI